MKSWKSTKLGDIATYINGYPFTPADWGIEGLPIIRIQNLTNSSRVSNYYSGDIDEKYEVNSGDVLISWSGSLGVFEWNRGPALVNQHIFKVVFDKEEVDKRFFRLVVEKSLRDMEKYLHGSTMKHITKGYFDNIEIPLPPIDTQRKIAAILDKAQELIDLRKAQIEKLDEFLRSVFLDMFGDPATNPKGWDLKPIGSIAQVQTGSTPSRDNSNYYSNGLIPWIKTGEVTGNMIFGAEEFINLKALDETNCKVFPQETILLAMYGQGQTRGRAGLLKLEAATNQACAAILPAKCLNSLYLFCQIRNRYDELRALGRGGNQPNLNLALVKGFEVLVPPLPLQHHFASIVEKTEQQRVLMQQSMTEMENNFSSLMQRAFRGELF